LILFRNILILNIRKIENADVYCILPILATFDDKWYILYSSFTAKYMFKPYEVSLNYNFFILNILEAHYVFLDKKNK